MGYYTSYHLSEIDFETEAINTILDWLTGSNEDKGLDLIRSNTLSASLSPKLAVWGRSIARRVRNEALEEAMEAVVRDCSACNGQGAIVVGVHEVTAEMAMDAGQPELAGMPYQEEIQQCEYCGRPCDAIRALQETGDEDR